MAIAINQFFDAITHNTIRNTNSFEMYATSGYNDIDQVLEGVTMFGKGFEIPSRDIEYAPVSFKGYEVGNAVPTRLVMGNEHTVTINADFAGNLRRAFLAWQGRVIDPAISLGSVLSGDRRVNNKSCIRIHLLDWNMSDVAEVYKMLNVKIKTVGPLNVTNEGGEVATFDVTFNSSYWEIEHASRGAFIDQK